MGTENMFVISRTNIPPAILGIECRSITVKHRTIDTFCIVTFQPNRGVTSWAWVLSLLGVADVVIIYFFVRMTVDAEDVGTVLGTNERPLIGFVYALFAHQPFTGFAMIDAIFKATTTKATNGVRTRTKRRKNDISIQMTMVGSDDVPSVYFYVILYPVRPCFVPASIAIARGAFIEKSCENFIGTAVAH
jgi:hypothetical protein